MSRMMMITLITIVCTSTFLPRDPRTFLFLLKRGPSWRSNTAVFHMYMPLSVTSWRKNHVTCIFSTTEYAGIQRCGVLVQLVKKVKTPVVVCRMTPSTIIMYSTQRVHCALATRCRRE
jgi:hypothetical protein